VTCQVNFHLYHYAGNNPVKYVDPDGDYIVSSSAGMGFGIPYQQDLAENWSNDVNSTSLYDTGCTLVAANRAIDALATHFYGDIKDILEGGILRMPISGEGGMNSDSKVSSSRGLIVSGIPSYMKENYNLDSKITRGKGRDVKRLLEYAKKSSSPIAVMIKIEGGKHTVNLDKYENGKFSGTDTSKRQRNLENNNINTIEEIILIELQIEPEE